MFVARSICLQRRMLEEAGKGVPGLAEAPQAFAGQERDWSESETARTALATNLVF